MLVQLFGILTLPNFVAFVVITRSDSSLPNLPFMLPLQFRQLVFLAHAPDFYSHAAFTVQAAGFWFRSLLFVTRATTLLP